MLKIEKLLVATSNQGKLKEILEIFSQGLPDGFAKGAGVNFSSGKKVESHLEMVPFKVISLKDLGIEADFEENENGFEENALGKARYYSKKSGLPTLAEDSGILVDALPGELGVKTRRWGAGADVSDEEWIEYFLKRMGVVEEGKRGGKFVCAAALVDMNGTEFVFRGETDGIITKTLEAPIYGGLPLSACFKPLGFDKVYSALSLEEKNKISHRGKALRLLFENVFKK